MPRAKLSEVERKTGDSLLGGLVQVTEWRARDVGDGDARLDVLEHLAQVAAVDREARAALTRARRRLELQQQTSMLRQRKGPLPSIM